MKCRFCGLEKDIGIDFSGWVKPTFTDHDKLKPGEIVCNDCLFWFDEASQELANKLTKDKPQKMRNYSHFIVGGQWTPLSKGDKSKMAELLLGEPFPELVAIAESGQKHIVFRTTRNTPGSKAGWVQFEEQQLWVEPQQLRVLIDSIQSLMIEFSKGEIETAQYKPYRIINFGIEQWQAIEQSLKPLRGSLLFNLALFLAQKTEDDSGRESGGFIGSRMARDRQRVQKPIPTNNLGAVREHGAGQCVHEQPGEVRQLSLFET